MERLENFEKALNDILNEYDNLGNELKMWNLYNKRWKAI